MPIEFSFQEFVTMYEFNELDDEAKQKARDNYIDYWVDDSWSDFAIEDAKANGLEYGFEIDKVYFTGFHSQGDGASWEGRVKLLTFINMFGKESIGFEAWRCLLESSMGEGVYASISTKRGHYVHSNTMTRSADFENYLISSTSLITTPSVIKGMSCENALELIMQDVDCPYKNSDDFLDWVLEEAKRYADSIYSALHEAYVYECSDDNIQEVYTANNVYFYRGGTQIEQSIVENYLETCYIEQTNKGEAL